MAQKRMFSMKIIDADAFLDMPLSTQALYFHLSMRADDDGFIGNHKRIMRTIGSNEDELKLLLTKNFIIPFESGVCVIKHWKMHNYIQKDRYHPTSYIEEKAQLHTKDNHSYTLRNGLDTKCVQNDVSVLGLDLELGLELELDYSMVLETWNGLGFRKIRILTDKRKKHIKTRVSEVTYEKFLETLLNLKEIKFFVDNKDKNWFDFDWVINPNNFIKIIEGKYEKDNIFNKQDKKQSKITDEELNRKYGADNN